MMDAVKGGLLRLCASRPTPLLESSGGWQKQQYNQPQVIRLSLRTCLKTEHTILRQDRSSRRYIEHEMAVGMCKRICSRTFDCKSPS